MESVQAFLREVSLRIREGKDGPEQYARAVIHIEMPNADAAQSVLRMVKAQKGPKIVNISDAQLELPAAAGMSR